MGVPQIWDLVREYQPDPISRYPIGVVLPKKRIAIDAYHILFECGFFNKTASLQDMGRSIVNLIHRIKELIALDVWFLLVFDGYNKPTKVKRSPTKDGSPIKINSGIDSNMIRNRMNGPQLNLVYTVLDILNISYATTLGEGEVFCCFLQKDLKMVDYVWSNDSDCLIFGGTKILKNYSKQAEDVGATSNHNNYFQKEKENLITIVDYENLVNEYQMLDKKQLLLYSILLGADYNVGVKGLGKKKCLDIVQLTEPNFSGIFSDIFCNINNSNKTEKEDDYARFQKSVFKYCQEHTIELFGRDYSKSLLSKKNDNFEGWPSIDIVLNYFHPLISKTVDDDVTSTKYSNISGSKGYDSIDFLKLKELLQSFNLGNISNFDKWFHDTVHEMFLVKYLLYEYDENQIEKIREKVTITEEKDILLTNNNNMKISYWKVRYNSFLENINCLTIPNRSSSPSRSPTRRQMDILEYAHGVWVCKNCIPETHVLVKDFQLRQKVAREESERQKKVKQSRISPKKRLNMYKQQNNLDSFIAKFATPVKDIPPLETINTEEKLATVRKRLFVEAGTDAETDSVHAEEIKDFSLEPSNIIADESNDSLVILDEMKLPKGNTIETLSPTKKIKKTFQNSEKPPFHQTTLPLVEKRYSFKEDEKSSDRTETLHPTVTLSPQKVPFLSRMDTFGNVSSHSILDKLTEEADRVVHELNSSDTDSTLQSTPDMHDNSNDFNNSDDLFFDL